MRYQGNIPRWAEETVYRKRLEIIRGLLAMRRAGSFRAIWCDDWKLHIQAKLFDPLERISWEDAELLVLEFRKCKRRARHPVRGITIKKKRSRI